MKYKLNILAPTSVAVIVITLGAAFGVLSGRGAFIGMISTCVITAITAIVGGSRYGVSSPTGPMTAAIGSILFLNQNWLSSHSSLFDAVALMNLTLVLSAAILLIFIVIRIHRLIKFIPNLVISGFVNGIALLIVISQFKTVAFTSDWILMFSTFALAFLVNQFGKNFSHPAIRIITSSLFTIIVMSIAARLLDMPISYLEPSSSEKIGLQMPPISAMDLETIKIILPLAFELALIALLDTMLTSVIMDKKSNTKTHFPRELTGQSISLFAASLFGGVPGAQSTVPSVMLLEEKGHHRLSKLLIAAFCLIFTLLLRDVIEFVPLAVFGGIILKIAYDVADLTSIKTLFKCPKQQRPIRFLILLGTCASTVLISLNLAVIGFTLLFVLWNNIAPKKFQIPDLVMEKESEGLIDEV